MKIGILTLPFNNNYGGYLQAYALMTVMKNEGYDVELIYRRHNKLPFTKLIVPTCKNIVKKLLGRKVVSIIPNPEKEFRARGASMMPFFDKYIVPRSKPLFSSKDFTHYVSGRYDAVIVGSDQVWRPDYGPGIGDFFFADVKDEKLIRMSYAASFGSENPVYSDEEIKICKQAVSLFKAVSVREQSGLGIIKSFKWKTNSDPQFVLDPTFLLDKEIYVSLLSGVNESKTKGRLFNYVLDSNTQTRAIISEASRIFKLDVFGVADIQKGNVELPSIEDWLCFIREASFVVTDSFHGMVFSIIFKKDFVVCPNIKRGADRFMSLLNLLGLEERIVTDEQRVQSCVKTPINWAEVEEVLRVEQNRSLNFIKENLS